MNNQTIASQAGLYNLASQCLNMLRICKNCWHSIYYILVCFNQKISNFLTSKYDNTNRKSNYKRAGIDSPSFSVHQVYPENLLQKLAKKAQQVGATLI